MNGVAPEPSPQIAAAEVQKLQQSFRIFNQVTRDLEKAYDRLETKASTVDSRLHRTNQRLEDRIGRLKAVTAELHGILRAIPCGVVACDAANALTRVNPAAERILGRPASELLGRDARVLRGNDGHPILLLGREGQECGVIVERKVSCLDGSIRFLSGSLAELPEGGRLEVVTDQTEVAHLRSQVNRLDVLAGLGEMAAGVAHEIRNPMNGVEGFAGLLEKALAGDGEISREQLRHYALRIRQGTKEMDGIINNLLLWARPERAVISRFAVSRLLRDVQDDLRAPFSDRDGEGLQVDLPPAALRLAGDALKLKLALGNLVRNAIEAAGKAGRVHVHTEIGEEALRIHVDDDGPGISPAVRLKLFRPFATTKASGTGLGLAIARKLIELHGGELAPGKSPLGGARFTITMPLSREAVS